MKQGGPGSWKDVGERVARARKAARLTQAQVAEALALDRSAIAKIENGTRELDALELVTLANVLHRAVDWFVRDTLPVVASHRDTAGEARESRADAEVDALVRDLAQLESKGRLAEASSWRPPGEVRSPADGEIAALAARKHLAERNPALDDKPLRYLARMAELFGLCSFIVELGSEEPDGIYVPVGERGATVINGRLPVGRRRFTLAHELAHHLFADEYTVDFQVLGDESELVINAFAIHFLMPRAGVEPAWQREIARGRSRREAAIALAAGFGVSWTAAVAQLQRLGLVSNADKDELCASPPKHADYVELEIEVLSDLEIPSISPNFAGAVLRAYRHHDISASRAVEMLRGTLPEAELPDVGNAPLEAVLGNTGGW